jgi:hypothetical protein
MIDSTTPPTWMMHVALLISASSVLDLLGHVHPQSHTAVESII